MKTLKQSAAEEIRNLWPDDHSIVQVSDFLTTEADTLASVALYALRTWLKNERLVIVPAEPTTKMFEAHSNCTSQELWAGIGWAAMIAAAPDALRDGE